MGEMKVFLVAKDFGVKPAFDLALCHPSRVSGVVTLGVPPLVGSLRLTTGLPEGFYKSRWKVNIKLFLDQVFMPFAFLCSKLQQHLALTPSHNQFL